MTRLSHESLSADGRSDLEVTFVQPNRFETRGTIVVDECAFATPQDPFVRQPLTSLQWRLAVVVELVLGALLGSLFLGTHSLFLDESVSSTLATAPWHRFANVVSHREANMALYYLLLRGWAVFGHSEIALRSLSVILAVGALWVVIMLARSLFGRRTALVAGLLFAVNPLFIQFAQDVRGYSLALLLVSASCFFFVRGIHQVGTPPRFCWTAYTVVTSLAAYTNFWAALVPVAQALSLGFLPPGRIPWRRVLASAAVLVVLLLPLGLLIRSTDSAGVDWASGSSAGHLFTHVRSSVPHAALDLLVLLAAVVVVAVVVLVRRRPATGALFAPLAAVFRSVLVDSAGGRGRDAIAGVQAAARGALPDGEPARGSAADRPDHRQRGFPGPPWRHGDRRGPARRRTRGLGCRGRAVVLQGWPAGLPIRCGIHR